MRFPLVLKPGHVPDWRGMVLAHDSAFCRGEGDAKLVRPANLRAVAPRIGREAPTDLCIRYRRPRCRRGYGAPEIAHCYSHLVPCAADPAICPLAVTGAWPAELRHCAPPQGSPALPLSCRTLALRQVLAVVDELRQSRECGEAVSNPQEVTEKCMQNLRAARHD